MVERYNCYGWDIRRGEMRREDDGRYVRHSDYAALEARYAELEKQVEDQKERLRQFADTFDSGYAAANRVATLRARIEREPVVKALEWKGERNCECSAESVVGMYEVGFDDGWWAQLEGGVAWDWVPDQDPRSYHGPAAAKAAAQADYERRILSALASAPLADDPRDTKPVVTHETANLEDNSSVVKALEEAEFWLEGALNCEGWRWDADQHEAATASLATIRAALASAPEPFPQPKRKDGCDPCGECHLQPGETCDICGTLASAPERVEAEPVSSIVPDGCTGSSLVFSEGILHVKKDGSGHIVVKEDDFQIETEYDDEGSRSDFWITRFPPGELDALRDFLNGSLVRASPPAPLVTEAWPRGCRKPGSCSRHKQCMYANCPNEGRDIAAEVEAAIASREAT